jgi:hypothetical protein
MSRIRPYRDYVLLKPRTDVLGLTTSLSLTMTPEAIERAKALSTNGTYNPTQFEIGANGKDVCPDSFAFGEVVEVGPGNRSLSECRPVLPPGMVVGYTRNRIAHSFHQDGELVHMVHEHGVVCEVSGLPLEVELRPLMNWVLTRRDAEGFQKAIGRSYPMDPSELAEGISTNHHQRPDVHGGTAMARPGHVVDSKVRMVVERVVATGPGRWVQPTGLPEMTRMAGSMFNNSTQREVWTDAQYTGRKLPAVWVENQAEPGHLAGFLRCGSSTRLYVRGVHYSLTPWQEFICAFEESATAEAAEFLGATG